MTTDIEDQSLSNDSCDVLTRCTVCSELYRDPLLLPCLHTFCTKCLRGRWTRSDPEPPSDSVNDPVVCPLCQAPSPDGLDALPANTFIANVAKVRRFEEERTTKQLNCSACSRHTSDESASSSTVAAVVFCVDCDDSLCKACSDAHRKLRVTEPHHLIQLSDDEFADEVEKALNRLVPTCRLHPYQPRTLYCQEAGCCTPICANCAVGAHRKHDFVDVAEVTASHREILQSSVGTIATVLGSLTNDRGHIRDAVRRLCGSLKQTEQDIAARATDLNETVAKRRRDLQEIVNYVHLDRMNRIGRAESELRRGKDMAQNVMVMCRELATRGSDVEVCNLAARYIARARQLLEAADVDLPKPVQLTFVPSSELKTTFKSQPETLFGTVDTLRETNVMLSAE